MFGREQTGAKMAGSRQDKGVGRRQRSLRAEFYLKKHVGPGIELSGWNACLASLEPHRFKPQPARVNQVWWNMPVILAGGKIGIQGLG